MRVSRMKKTLSFLFIFLIVISSVFTFPTAAFAEQQDATYKVTSKVYADAYMLINLDDDEFPVIAAKNQSKRKYPASLTKIATAAVVLNNVKNIKAKTKKFRLTSCAAFLILRRKYVFFF